MNNPKATVRPKYWKEEFVKAGTRNALISRLLFHSALNIAHVVELTGLSFSTIRRNFKKLLDEKYIEPVIGIEDLYKITASLRKDFMHLGPKIG